VLAEKMQPMRAIATYVNICTKKISHESALSGISTKRRFVALSHICWLAPCFVIFGNAHATTVIAVTTDDSAFIGADSRTDPHGTVCKIVVGNGVAVGMSGLLADSATHFRAATTIKGALSRASNLTTAIDSTIAALEPPLKRSLEWGFRNAPAEYSRYQGKDALALLFIGINHGAPQITYFVWRTENGGISRLPARTLGANAFNGIGAFDAIVNYVIQTPEWRSLNPVTRITTALQIESEASPEDIGPSFSIVRITPTSTIEWVQGGACSAGKQR
jgi:hypothetical protein